MLPNELIDKIFRYHYQINLKKFQSKIKKVNQEFREKFIPIKDGYHAGAIYLKFPNVNDCYYRFRYNFRLIDKLEYRLLDKQTFREIFGPIYNPFPRIRAVSDISINY